MLGLAAKLELPVIFVVLPATKGEKRSERGESEREDGAGGECRESLSMRGMRWRCTGWRRSRWGGRGVGMGRC